MAGHEVRGADRHRLVTAGSASPGVDDRRENSELDMAPRIGSGQVQAIGARRARARTVGGPRCSRACVEAAAAQHAPRHPARDGPGHQGEHGVHRLERHVMHVGEDHRQSHEPVADRPHDQHATRPGGPARPIGRSVSNSCARPSGAAGRPRRRPPMPRRSPPERSASTLAAAESSVTVQASWSRPVHNTSVHTTSTNGGRGVRRDTPRRYRQASSNKVAGPRRRRSWPSRSSMNDQERRCHRVRPVLGEGRPVHG